MKISIAMAVYNGSNYILQQLESLAKQSLLPDELIISDDCSTDDTLSICSKFSNTSPFPVKIISNISNLGYQKNFERALIECNGDVVFLCDQDDYWFENKIKTMIAEFSSNKNIGLVYCNGTYATKDLIPLDFTLFDTSGTSELAKGNDRHPFDLIKNPRIKGCTMAFLREYLPYILPIRELKNNHFWGHDYQLAFTLSSFTMVSAIEEPLMLYRVHEKNTSHKKVLRKNTPNHQIDWNKELKYSSDMVLVLRNKYIAALEIFAKIRSSGLYFDMEKLMTMENMLNKELNILSERISIWSEENFLVRIKKIYVFLSKGYYFKFKKWVVPLFRDILHNYFLGIKKA